MPIENPNACLFCGAKTGKLFGVPNGWAMRCQTCGAQGSEGLTPAEAVELWDRPTSWEQRMREIEEAAKRCHSYDCKTSGGSRDLNCVGCHLEAIVRETSKGGSE
jgi:hypothetical protein